MLRFSLILLLTSSLFIFQNVSASHMAGGSIKYTYVGPGSVSGTHKYEIRVGIYRWCAGANITGTTQTITARCTSTGAAQTFSIPVFTYVSKPGERPANGGKRDVSDVCSSKSSRCNSTTGVSGYEELIFKGAITLGSCASWEITTLTVCCRNSIQNFNANGAIQLKSIFNTKDFPINSAPTFADSDKPLPSVCLGQDVFFGVGTTDLDGDSLSFELTCPDNAGSSSTGRNGFTCARPITNLKLDSSTGLITFRHTGSVGAYAVAFWVKEYERCTGKLKGQTRREIQFDIKSCSNKVPRDISGMTNVKGNATKIGTNEISVCQGEKFSWEDTIFDGDVTDTLLFSTNLQSSLPGATMTKTFLSRNKCVLKFEWTAALGNYSVKSFFVSFNDDRCDFPGNGVSVFKIRVKNSTSTGPDQVVCIGDSVKLRGYGGRVYNWRSISGDPLVSGVNWFPDTTANDTNKTVTFIVMNATRIELKSDLKMQCATAFSCNKLDTILIQPVDSFSISTSPNMFLCNPAAAQLNATPSRSSLKYTYKWNNKHLLNNDSVKNPTFSNVLTPTRFKVTVTNTLGCARKSYVDVNVSDPFPKMKIMASDTLVCLSKQIKLWVEQGSVKYNTCDTPIYKCQGTFKNYTLGNGAVVNQSRVYTSPMTYGSYAYSQKSQYLYTASDLKAMGMKAGPITSIAWDIQSLYNNTSAPLNGFAIKMGCTRLTDLPRSGFVSGLIQVFNPKSTLPVVGWNVHKFDHEYSWDGTSNLVVEVCWANGSSRLNGQHIQKFDNMGYRASSSYYQQFTWNSVACSNSALSPGFPSTTLPRTRFNSCTGIRAGLYKYDWGPKSTGGFVGATNKDSVVVNTNLGTPKNYTVYIEDSTFGVCRDTLSIKVNVISAYDVKPNNPGKQCLTKDTIKLTSKTPWNVTSPGGTWLGKGIIDSKLGYWDPTLSGIGKHWVKYRVVGNACAAEDSTLIEIVGRPDVSILKPDSLCKLYGSATIQDTIRHRLVPKNPGGWFRGFGVDSIVNKSGVMVYSINGSLFNPTKNKPDTAFINYQRSNGCVYDSTVKVAVFAPWDHSFLGVLDQGVPYSTVNFCASNPQMDTLAVAGPNPIWEYLDKPSAMIDRNLGVLDSRIASFSKDYVGKIKVGFYGFCGSDTTIQVTFIKAPEVEVLAAAYCKEFVNDPANFSRIDTVWMRIPKGPLLAGSTGKKSLDPNGFDPLTEVKLNYASIAGSGWPTAVDQTSNQFDYNFWDGKPWMPLNFIARYRIFALPSGKNKIKYNFAIRYRQNSPNNFTCPSSDSSFVEKVDSLIISLKDTHRICGSNSVLLDPGPYHNAKYLWSNGNTTNSITVSKKGIFVVTVTTDYCRSSKQTVVLNGCVGIDKKLEDGVQIKLFPNPTSNTINLQVNGVKNETSELKIFDLLGSEVSNTILNSNELIQGIEIDISKLESGTYYFKIISGESHSTYRVIVD